MSNFASVKGKIVITQGGRVTTIEIDELLWDWIDRGVFANKLSRQIRQAAKS